MASEEDLINRTARREVLRSFSLSETETSVERNLRRARAHHDNLMHQRVAAEDAPEMARLLDAEMASVEHIIEEEQAHRAQVAALSQMQLQAMERVEEQERELRRLSNLMAQHQAILTTSPERPQPQSPPPTSPPHNLARLRGEIQHVLPGTVNTLRGAADRAGQVSDLGNLPNLAEDTLHDILEEELQEEIPVTPQRQVRFQTSTPVVRPEERLRERVQPSRVPQMPSAEKSLSRYPEARDLFEEGFSRSLQAAATEFKKLREPKVAKFKGGYSSDASLIFQSWLKDIRVYTIERRLSQREAIQLVKDYTSEQARSEVEYYLGLTPEEEQSFQGLIDHLSLAFQSCETVSSLIADFYNRFQKTRETEDAFADELQVLVRKIVARKPEFIHEANQALKHQYAQNLRDPYFGVVARGQCLSSPDSESFTQFRGRLALMFNSRGKQQRARATVSATAAECGDIEHLSRNSRQRQNKIDAQAAEIAHMKTELNKALQENKQLKNMFSTEKMVEAMTKAVSSMTVQSRPSLSSKGTQYKEASNFIGRPRPPQLARGADGTLLPSITCNYCKDTGHFKDNCVRLNNKLARELAQEEVTRKASDKSGSTKQLPKK